METLKEYFHSKKICNHQQLHFAMLQQEVLLWFLAHTQHCINGNIEMLLYVIFSFMKGECFQNVMPTWITFSLKWPLLLFIFPSVIPPSIMGILKKILKLIYFPEETCHIQDLDFCFCVLKFTFIITTNIITYI